MKKLTLKETWRLCLSMWRWIAKQIRAKNAAPIWMLKEEWLKTHGFALGNVWANCFFCQYDLEHAGDCSSCPGRKVDQDFDCREALYHYRYNSIAFYNKLVSLNRKRAKK